MENENQNTKEAAELVQEFPLLGEFMEGNPSQSLGDCSPQGEPGTKETESYSPAQPDKVSADTLPPLKREIAPIISGRESEGGASPAAAAPRGEAVPDPVPQLQKDLESALQRVQQLERERWLLSQGVPEEDLDYYAFKIGKLVTPEKDFTAAAKDYIKTHRGPRGVSTGAGLSGRVSKAPGINDTMNRLIRGDS